MNLSCFLARSNSLSGLGKGQFNAARTLDPYYRVRERNAYWLVRPSPQVATICNERRVSLFFFFSPSESFYLCVVFEVSWLKLVCRLGG